MRRESEFIYFFIFLNLFNNFCLNSLDILNLNYLNLNQNFKNVDQNNDYFVAVLHNNDLSTYNFLSFFDNNRNQLIDLAIIQNMPQDILFQYLGSIEDLVLFKSYHLYSNQNYLDYIRARPGYEDFILILNKKIQKDHSLRKSLRKISGFSNKKGFTDLIKSESDRIIKEQEKKLREENKIKQQEKEKLKKQQKDFWVFTNNYAEELEKKFLQKYVDADKIQDQNIKSRYKKRLESLYKTIKQNGKQFDYSDLHKKYPKFNDPYADVFNDCYGTELDKLLHEELCEIRKDILSLNSRNLDNFYIQKITPAINYYTALAKVQSNPNIAFDLSDFSESLVNVFSKCVDFTQKCTLIAYNGIKKGAEETLSLQHWQNMALGTVKLGVFCLGEAVKEDFLDQACLSLNCEDFYKYAEHYQKYSQKEIQIINAKANDTLEKLKNMPWQELTEKGVEFGTTLVLDTLTLNIVSGVLNKTSFEYLNELEFLFNQNNNLTKEYLTEIAGVGKIAAEEGAEITSMAIDITCENLKNLQQTERSLLIVTKQTANLANENGKKFEEFLVKKLGGRGSFKVKAANGTREFDGAVGNVWYEAKSGKYWDTLKTNPRVLENFKERMGSGLKIARENSVKYELYSDSKIPDDIKEWLMSKGISFTEFLEGK